MRKHFGSGLSGEDIRTVRGELQKTRWAMWSETLVRAFWPAFALVCFLLAMALLGGFSAFGPLAHRILLGVAVLLIAASLVWGGMRLNRPGMAEITERLDQSDRRRPLSALRDRLAVGKGQDVSETVWRAHRERARGALSALKARWPDLRLSEQDSWGLRYVAPVLLIVAIIGGGASLPGRLSAITDPAPLNGTETAQVFDRDPAAEAWITPPAYTGQPTIYLERQAADAAPIKVPQGSELTIRVTDTADLPVLDGEVLTGIESFTSLGGGLAEARGLVSGTGALGVTVEGQELARWQIEMIPDLVPEIELAEKPSTTLTGALDLFFRARDDYGVVAAWAEIAPEGHDPENAKGLPLPIITFGLPLPLSGDTKQIEDSAIRDFSSHPWAGAELEIRLFAEDGAAQTGTTETETFILPGRRFSHPVARALVEQRRDLALDYGDADRVLDVLQAVTRRPHELFDDPGVYLTVRTAIRRLASGIGTETVPDQAPDVIEFLWQAALALEDGDLSGALERLRQAQENLRKALESGSDEDVRRAMDELRQAMNEYLQQLAEHAQRNPQQQGQMNPDQMMSQQDLQDMLDQMQRQAESGMRDQARELLSQLNRMLENMQAAQRQQGQGQNQQALQELQEMIQRQRDLSDRTFDELRQRRREQQLGSQNQQGRQQGQQGQQQPGWGEGQGRGDEHGRQGQQGEEGFGEQNSGQQPGTGGLAREQEALRRELENLSRGLGSNEAAEALEEALRSMGAARDDLQEGANSDAVRDQMDALDSLNEGAEALAQEMRQGQGDTQARGNRRGQGEGRDNEENDPFDRPTSSFGALDGRSTRVPDQDLIDRARELMEELRRRAAEPSRPRLELDYLDRLMDRF